MPDAFALLFFLALLGAAFVSLLLGVIAYARTRKVLELTRRVEKLERRLETDRRATAAAEATAAPVAAASSTNAPPAAATARTERPPAAAPAQPAHAAPLLVLPALPPQAPSAPGEERRAIERAGMALHWERWLGVRGAAVLGGILLALAGVLLVQHSIERGWITPALRVGIAMAAGSAALIASVPLHRRGYRQTSDALAGAGAVILYGALWGGRSLYGLFGSGTALSAMIAVTAASGWTALRRPSLAVAVFALVGGFATPMLLSLGADRPLVLFGYLLVFDLAIVAAAHRPRFGVLVALGAAGTLIVFAAFLFGGLRPGEELLALAFLGLSSLVLALPALSGKGEDRAAPSPLGAALALLGSFPLAVYIAHLDGMERRLLPLVLFAAALQALAGFVAWRRSAPWLATGAAVGAVALMLARAGAGFAGEPRAWTLLVALGFLAAIPHGMLEWRRRAGAAEPDLAAPLAALGMALALAVAVLEGPHGSPILTDSGVLLPRGTGVSTAVATLAAGILFGALLLRQGALNRMPFLALAAALVPAGLWLALGLESAPWGRRLDPSCTLATVVPVLLFAGHALAVRRSTSARAAFAALTLAAVAMTVVLAPAGRPEVGVVAAAFTIHAAAVGLLLLACVGAAGTGSGLALLSAVLACASMQAYVGWWTASAGRGGLAAISLQLVAALAVALAPAWSGPRAAQRGALWAVAAVAPWIWLPSLMGLFAQHASPGWRAAPALALAAWSAATWLAAGRALESSRSAAVAAAATSTLALLAVALTLQLERGLWTVAPALAGLGAAWSYRRTTHVALPWVAAALLAWSTLRLGLEMGALSRGQGDWPRTGWPVVHWGTYGWALPAAAALVSSTWLRRTGSGRDATLSASACGACGVLLLFLWVNLEVQNLFQEGPLLELVLRREPVRDAATSIAWGLFALGLLVAGLRTRGTGLRWASLGFFLATILKAFLVDMANLEGLYRVASIAALALALLAVSLLYQRFVFRGEEASAPG